ncbi:MAG: prolipoprotein diacylglyceryl transferase [Clostridia bacterium]|nr:prolipoprotein diacylglyceryl transferase [Clostridia bacterium]
MYSHELFLGITLYDLCVAIGAVVAFLLFRLLSDRLHLSARVTNLALVGGVVGIAIGLGAATLLQAFYNFMAGEAFAIVENTGSTFYGGLIGGIVGFLAVYLGGGARRLPKGAARASLSLVASMAACSIAAAHGIGRIGCFFAGCCHGIVTEAWYGIYMPAVGARVLPTQLIEAIFLFALAALLYTRAARGKRDGFFLYLTAYGVFRFFLEYLRGDYRGASLVSFLTPSQLIALLMVAVGISYYLLSESKKTENDGNEEEAAKTQDGEERAGGEE